jgi:hypothetical protein
MKDLGLNKGLKSLEGLRQRLVDITDRFAGFEAQSLNVHVDFPLFQKIALPVASGKTKIAGIKIHDTRMMRLMEVLLHGGTQLNGWRSADIHQAILTSFGLSAARYTLTQLRYDVRKMKAHGLLERNGGRYLYRLTDKGIKVDVRPVSPARMRTAGQFSVSPPAGRSPQARQQDRSRIPQSRSRHPTSTRSARRVKATRKYSERRFLRFGHARN